MKIASLCALLAACYLMAGCEATVVERHHGPYRRYISYSETDPYYRVYYRDGGRAYYRQHYYEDDPHYSSYVDRRRYYYTAPASRASIHFGF